MIRQTLAVLLATLALALPTLAQDGYQAQTAGDNKVATDVLQLKLRPLQVGEVEAEATAWQAELARVAKQISDVEVAGKEGGDTSSLSTLREEQTRITNRMEIVLQALTARGGDRAPFDQYIAAATALSLDPTDVGGFAVMARDWALSEEGGVLWLINIIKFLVTLFVFKILAGIIGSIVKKAVGRLKGTSDLLRDFFVNVTRRVVFFIGLIVALSMLGIDITPFVAALGAAGFVIGFALQGTLSNFASGLMILVYRPYDIGQVVTVAGTTGTVDAMTLVSTTLKLPDNQTGRDPEQLDLGRRDHQHHRPGHPPRRHGVRLRLRRRPAEGPERPRGNRQEPPEGPARTRSRSSRCTSSPIRRSTSSCARGATPPTTGMSTGTSPAP